MESLSVTRFVAVAALALALAGCSTPDVLREPEKIPSLVSSYEVQGLRAHTHDVPVILDLSECVEMAALSSSGFSGRPSIAGRFPVRELVKREFNKVIAVNFRTTFPNEHPKLVLEVRSESVQVSRSWSKVKCHMTFSVRIVDPVLTDRKPYFSRRYEMSAEGMQKNKDEVPVCVYSEIQNLAKRFLEDIPREQNGTLVTRLRELGVGAAK